MTLSYRRVLRALRARTTSRTRVSLPTCNPARARANVRGLEFNQENEPLARIPFMTTPTSAPSETRKRYRPYVPENMEMPEFTPRAVLLGLVMTVILGAANAYLGLRAGITIAATYPAAVIGMAVLRIWKGTVLEENIARTSGTIGEGIAAGAIFTIPAFMMSKAWPSFGFVEAYWNTIAIMMMDSVLGVLFISLVRRGMVE